jgi:competence CoiA-like predicted nuclease
MKTYSSLTKKQAALYDSLVEDIKAKLEAAEEGIERKADTFIHNKIQADLQSSGPVPWTGLVFRG